MKARVIRIATNPTRRNGTMKPRPVSVTIRPAKEE